MNWDQLEGNWKQFKGKVQSEWGRLTEDEIEEIGGNRERLEGIIQERYGLAKDRAQKRVDHWLEKME